MVAWVEDEETAAAAPAITTVRAKARMASFIINISSEDRKVFGEKSPVTFDGNSSTVRPSQDFLHFS
jgi:hypothetical protein